MWSGIIIRRRAPTQRHGFTLIELLVTISIIAVLLAILLPSLRSARAEAKRIVCSTHLHEISGAIWNYWTEHNGRVPFVKSPMTNGGAIIDEGVAPGFGDGTTPSAELNPFDRELWPESLPNVLMPAQLGNDQSVFACPSAVNGWPVEGPVFRYAYRPAAANQTNGAIAIAGSYFRENFGFLDGRMLQTFRIELTGDLIMDAQLMARRRSTYLRDFVTRVGGFHGPHRKGINAVDRGLAVVFRSRSQAAADLASSPSGEGVAF